MQIISDLHIHSRHSRGCSINLDIKNLERYARVKGVNLLGTGDFTHPEWLKELKKRLVDERDGIYYTANGFPFLLQTEIALIYSQDGKGRRIHNVILAPSFDVVEQITEYLLKHGRVDYDGRPIFKIPCYEFVERLLDISKDIEVIPAHIWTPWFSLFGSNSGFNSVEECFKDRTKHIHALETGLSSNPAMNWRLSQLDKYSLVSFSDSHSYWPWRIGREATVFDCDMIYKEIINAIRTRQGLKMTVEVDPNLGKYHLTGHRNCGICMKPGDSKKIKDICPKCGRKLTVGVLERVEELADRPDVKPKDAVPYKALTPLSELLSVAIGKAVAAKAVWSEYYKLVGRERSEFDVLLNLNLDELKKLTTGKIADLIIKNREGKIAIKPGYDGVYGVPLLSEDEKEGCYEIKDEDIKQRNLTEF